MHPSHNAQHILYGHTASCWHTCVLTVIFIDNITWHVKYLNNFNLKKNWLLIKIKLKYPILKFAEYTYYKCHFLHIMTNAFKYGDSTSMLAKPPSSYFYFHHSTVYTIVELRRLKVTGTKRGTSVWTQYIHFIRQRFMLYQRLNNLQSKGSWHNYFAMNSKSIQYMIWQLNLPQRYWLLLTREGWGHIPKFKKQE